MKHLRQLFPAHLAILLVTLLHVGSSSAQATDDSVSANPGADDVVTDAAAEMSSSPDSASSSDMTEESDTEADAATASDTESPEDTAMEEEEAAAANASGDAPESLAPEIQYNCSHGSAVRTIRVFFGRTEGLACEVTYEKSSGTSTLWTAINSRDYCVDKAQRFAEKQAGWGWQCTDMSGNVVSLPEPEAEPEAEPQVESEAETSSEPEAVTEPDTTSEPEGASEPEA